MLAAQLRTSASVSRRLNACHAFVTGASYALHGACRAQQGACLRGATPAPRTAGSQKLDRNDHPRRGASAAAAAAYAPSSPPDFTSRGPHSSVELPQQQVLLGPSPSGASAPLTATLTVFRPQNVPKSPLLVFSNGFLVQSTMYRSYAAHLASWGWTVVLYDVSELVPDTQHVLAISRILDTCSTDMALAARLDLSCVALAGHSRGGKLSALAAGSDRRVRGLALLDPVDNTAMTPAGPGWPSALPDLQRMSSSGNGGGPLPVLVVGAAMGGDVIPRESNYGRFTVASTLGVAWEVELSGAGHLQFLDAQLGILSAFSAPGPTPDASVRAVSAGAMAAWLELVVRPAAGGRCDGRASAEAVFKVADALRRAAPLRSRLLGLEKLRPLSAGSSPSSSSASAATSGSSQYQASGSTSTTSSSSSSSNSSSSSSSSSVSSSGRQTLPPVEASYDELMRMRAATLKALLVERGVGCDDCFDKESLARRVLERCGGGGAAAAAATAGARRS